MEVVSLLRSVSVDGPVAMGDVIVADIAGMGVDVVASRDMPTLEERWRELSVVAPGR